MNKIKFRAWDKSNKSYCDYIAIDKYGDIMALSATFGGYDYASDEEANIIIQRYTGLNDATGKQVYEGDIIKSDRLNFKEEVIFYKGAFMSLPLSELVYEEDEYSNLYFMLNGPLKCKVVGNIYESKEV